MPDPGPSPAADRGAALLRGVCLARATHRCLAVHGHVDDLLPTPGGSALRLPELLAIDGSRNGIMTVVASEARGATTLTPPDTPRPARPVRLAPAPLAELLDRLLEQLAGQPSLLLLQGVNSAEEQDQLLGERLRDLPFDRRLADGAAQVVASFRGRAPAALQGATGWDICHLPLPAAPSAAPPSDTGPGSACSIPPRSTWTTWRP